MLRGSEKETGTRINGKLRWDGRKTPTSPQDWKELARRIFAQDPLQAECYAIWWGLQYASHIGQNLIIKSDCREAVEALKDPTKATMNIASIVADIRATASKIKYSVCINVCRNQVRSLIFLPSKKERAIVFVLGCFTCKKKKGMKKKTYIEKKN